jgi:hypothetical protein
MGFLGERLAHPRRDGSLKIKLDACRRRMERLVSSDHILRVNIHTDIATMNTPIMR